MEKKANDPLVEIYSGSLWEAELIKGLLEANGIPSMVKDESLEVLTSPYSNIGGFVKVLVDDADYPIAQKIIEEREPLQEEEEE